MTVLDTIYQFQGVLGAILGSVTTLVTSQLLRNSGRIYFSLKSFQYEFEVCSDDEYEPHYLGVDDPFKAEYINFNVYLHVYNNSELDKVIKNPRLRFDFTEKTEVGNVIIFDRPKKIVSGILSFKKGGEQGKTFLNIPGKQMTEVAVNCRVGDDGSGYIRNLKKCYILYYDYKGRQKKQRIWSSSFVNRRY